MNHNQCRSVSRNVSRQKNPYRYEMLPLYILGFVLMLFLITAMFVIVDYFDNHDTISISEQIKTESVTNTSNMCDTPIKDSKRKLGVGYQLNGKLGYGDKSLMLYSF